MLLFYAALYPEVLFKAIFKNQDKSNKLCHEIEASNFKSVHILQNFAEELMPAQQKCLISIAVTQQFKLIKMATSINTSGNTGSVIHCLVQIFPSWTALPTENLSTQKSSNSWKKTANIFLLICMHIKILHLNCLVLQYIWKKITKFYFSL